MNLILFFILGILGFFYFLDLLVEQLNLRAITLEVPKEFVGYYDANKYSLSQKYLQENTHFHSIESTVEIFISIAFILLGGFAFVDHWVRSFGFGEIGSGLCFIGALVFGSSILGLPFDLYSTFVIEEKYGFNKTTWKIFLGDRLKGILLGAVIGGGALALVLWFFENFSDRAWIYAWAAFTVLQIILLFLAPAIIMPLFNRFEPLAEGELKTAIQNLAAKQGFQMEGVFTMDGSKRSTKANAFFTGFGKFRRIVLFDTLIAKHSVEELVAVLAHEIGHYKLRHIFKMLTVSFLSTGLLFYICSLLLKNEQLFQAFQMENISTYASLVFISMLYSPLSKLLGIFSSYLSRKHEFEADAYAKQAVGGGKNLIEALKKLSVENLSNLTPHPWKVFLEYSHPPVLERVKALL